MSVFGCLLSATSLANTNSTKVLELEDELSSLLRDTVAGREEIEVASFNEDEVLALTALCARLDTLAGMRDMTTWVEEDEGGKQSSAWDIISALVDRGRLGYKEEESVRTEYHVHPFASDTFLDGSAGAAFPYLAYFLEGSYAEHRSGPLCGRHAYTG